MFSTLSKLFLLALQCVHIKRIFCALKQPCKRLSYLETLYSFQQSCKIVHFATEEYFESFLEDNIKECQENLINKKEP